jgi:hypothetical protein
VGSKGSKPRKPSHSQHLPKVGTKTEARRVQHAERQAVADTMGVGNAPTWIKFTAVFLVVALVGLALWEMIRIWA